MNSFKNVLEYKNGSKFATGLIRPTLQSEIPILNKKNMGVKKKSEIPYFQAPVAKTQRLST